MVVSSTATMPERAPASIAMLQIVIRPSMLSARMVEPANSIANPVPPAVPIRPITASTTSLAVTPRGSAPSTSTRMLRPFLAVRHCVASASSTSEVPMPQARQAKAPCVEVWESPQTTVMPGSVAPCSGPITWTMPWRTSAMSKYGMRCSRALASSVSTCSRAIGSGMPAERSVVGTL